MSTIRDIGGKAAVLVLPICNLVEYLMKIYKNPDGLVWTIFGGCNPKVGVNHVKFGCLISITLLCWFMYFVYMMMIL